MAESGVPKPKTPDEAGREYGEIRAEPGFNPASRQHWGELLKILLTGQRPDQVSGMDLATKAVDLAPLGAVVKGARMGPQWLRALEEAMRKASPGNTLWSGFTGGRSNAPAVRGPARLLGSGAQGTAYHLPEEGLVAKIPMRSPEGFTSSLSNIQEGAMAQYLEDAPGFKKVVGMTGSPSRDLPDANADQDVLDFVRRQEGGLTAFESADQEPTIQWSKFIPSNRSDAQGRSIDLRETAKMAQALGRKRVVPADLNPGAGNTKARLTERGVAPQGVDLGGYGVFPEGDPTTIHQHSFQELVRSLLMMGAQPPSWWSRRIPSPNWPQAARGAEELDPSMWPR